MTRDERDTFKHFLVRCYHDFRQEIESEYPDLTILAIRNARLKAIYKLGRTLGVNMDFIQERLKEVYEEYYARLYDEIIGRCNNE